MHQTSHPHKNRTELDVSVEKGIIRMPIANNFVEQFPYLDLDWDGSYVQKRCHSGRTDSNYGHHVFTNPTNNRGVALGTYHFHHTHGPHIPCCRTGSNQRAASIINPYTGREIALGVPYIFEGQAYFSINLVARALTIWDTFGASLSALPVLPPFFDAGGSFSACNLGESSSGSDTLGERFSFTYPTVPVIGTIRNNTFFHADGNRDGRLELLCHTTQAELDPHRCYAYINLETLREYMLSGNFFTDFAPNLPANVWSFTHSVALAEITAPQHNENFHAGDILRVRAMVQDVREATLTINGQSIEERTGLSGREIVFNGYQLTESDIGSLRIGVEARNGQNIAVNLPSVRVNVFAIPVPNVRIISPQTGNTFTTGDSIEVEVEVENATRSELMIGDHRQTVEHTMGRQRVRFNPYTSNFADALKPSKQAKNQAMRLH
jgi:hypothetical protein